MTRDETPSFQRLLRQEEFILDVTETLAKVMSSKGVTKTELAKKLGKSKSFITQILGGRNLTLRTVADVAQAVGCQPRMQLFDRIELTQVPGCRLLRWPGNKSAQRLGAKTPPEVWPAGLAQ